MKTNPKNTIGILVAGLFAVASIGSGAYLTNMILSKVEKLEILKAETAVLAAKDSAIQRSNEIFEKTQEERSILQALYVREENVVPFLDSVEEAAKETTDTFAFVTVQKDKDRPNVLLYNGKAQGSFSALMNLLVVLEKSPYPVDFATVSLEKEKKAEEISILSDWNLVVGGELKTFVPNSLPAKPSAVPAEGENDL